MHETFTPVVTYSLDVVVQLFVLGIAIGVIIAAAFFAVVASD